MLNWNTIISFVNKGNPTPDRRVEKTEQQWEEILTPDQFYITRKHGTERSYSNEFCSRFEPGRYSCACCHSLLFDANEKFESGSGWPSFTQPVAVNSIKYSKDVSFGMIRVEAQCNVCDAHLGHVFPDGPAPTGLRYCMNGLALTKEEKA
ncbi:peptide-methionine (R)-S-oxide reductase MsrB [Sphingobacterium rhinopitheci]|uniref:peptide-methionine (R)-S-oxide reductase MsrB n=1 Tax=Sphingobacterium rhinopitheci TaxID=2781960 RepID=UPI001F51729E|nr:peptide-methionine (R)-S-oxide reductase MsrB [Sphingobacterium rhinopitheci]MCI0922459.1 peptide-methionine (R)-S-oxide reductase MsrB [Sphingobacterium rhinopitheci]